MNDETVKRLVSHFRGFFFLYLSRSLPKQKKCKEREKVRKKNREKAKKVVEEEQRNEDYSESHRKISIRQSCEVEKPHLQV